jgi:tetratricopeptide (TPR) repeat protein
MSQEEKKKADSLQPQVVHGEVIPSDEEEEYEEEFEDEDLDDEEEFDEAEDYEDDDDDEYDEDDEEEAVDYAQQAQALASALGSSGLLSQMSALLGGGGAIPGDASFLRGRAMQASGDLEAAAEGYLDAIDENPEHLKAYIALGQVLLAIDKPDEAITFLEKASELDPNDAGSYLYLGYCYYTKEEYARCVEYFAQVVELEPNHTLAYNNLGFAYYLTGDMDASAKTFIKAGDVGSERAYYNLGMVRLVQGKEKEGWQAYEDAFELDPRGTQIEEHLDDLQAAKERHPEVLALLEESERRLLERADDLGLVLGEEE